MTTKNFVVKNGLTTGNIILDASSSNITANVVVANLYVPATANLGSVANVTITGGSSGYVLSTNGSGVLSWADPGAGTGGYSNANVAAYLPTYTGEFSVANITATGNITATYLIGNIDGTNATLTGDVTAASFIAGSGSGGNITGANVISANYFIGNGSQLTGLPASYANANVAAYLPTYNGNFTADNASITGNFTAGNANISGTLTVGAFATTGSSGNITGANYVVANYFIGNGSQLTGLPASYANANVAAYLPTYTGDISGNNATLTGNISGINATLTGDVTAASFIAGSGSGGNITGANFVVANFFSGDGSLLDNIVAGNIDGQVSNALVSGTVYIAAQPNITSTGTLTSLSVTNTITGGNLTTNGTLNASDATITGNLTVGGNVNYINVETLVIEDPIIEMGGGPNGDPLTTNDGKDRGSLLHYYTTTPVDAFMGWDNSNGEFAFGSNVSLSSEVVTFNTFGNVRASTFIGSLSGLASSATTAVTVTASAQPNITSLGTLSSLTVTGLITATAGGIKVGNLQDPSGTNIVQLLNSDMLVTGNISAGAGGTGNITATYFIGNGSQLTGLPAGYANSNVAAYLPTYTGELSVANITSTGNITAAYFIGNGSQLTGLPASYSNTNVAAYLPTYTGNVSANYFIGNGSELTDIVALTVSGAAQSNITSLGTLSGLTSTGVIDFTSASNVSLGIVGNIHITGGSAGQVLSTNGSGTLSWVDQGGGGGTSSNAAYTFDSFSGNGVQTEFTLSTTPSANTVLINYNGALQLSNAYTITGNVVTMSEAPADGSNMEVVVLSGGAGGSSPVDASALLSPFLLMGA